MAVNANPRLQQQKAKPKGKSSSKAATAPNSGSTAFTRKKIETAKPNSSKAPMLASDFDESEFLKGLDFEMGSEEEVTISEVTAELVGEEEKNKPVLSFKEIAKKLVLNKTNRTEIAKSLGNDMTRWPGHRVILYPAMVQFKTEMVQAVRVRMPGPKMSSGGSSLRRKV